MSAVACGSLYGLKLLCPAFNEILQKQFVSRFRGSDAIVESLNQAFCELLFLGLCGASPGLILGLGLGFRASQCPAFRCALMEANDEFFHIG